MKAKDGLPNWRTWLPTLHEEIGLHGPASADGSARNKHDIFRWYHELDERRWTANDLARYLKGFTDGTIEA